MSFASFNANMKLGRRSMDKIKYWLLIAWWGILFASPFIFMCIMIGVIYK